MRCKQNEESQCWMEANKEKMVICALVSLSVACTVAGVIIGNHCAKKWRQKKDLQS